jgi:HPt (histidine-containing phosphotransfer) domain-containing protein
MNSADVDIRAVNALISLFGAEKTGEHIRDFCARVEELLPELAKIVDQRDLDELRRTAHDLNGTAGHLGFAGFSRQAERVERAVRDGKAELALNEARELAPGYATARTSLHAHFPDLVPGNEGP